MATPPSEVKVDPVKVKIMGINFYPLMRGAFNLMNRYLWQKSIKIDLQNGKSKVVKLLRMMINPHPTHLNRDKIESNLSVHGIQGCLENALYKVSEMSPH